MDNNELFCMAGFHSDWLISDLYKMRVARCTHSVCTKRPQSDIAHCRLYPREINLLTMQSQYILYAVTSLRPTETAFFPSLGYDCIRSCMF